MSASIRTSPSWRDVLGKVDGCAALAQCLEMVFILFIIAACVPVSTAPVTTLPPPNVTIISATLTPTLMPTPTATPTVDRLIFPYTIDGLRAHVYESGDIHIREKLVENESYTTYYIDYPSDGLTITGILQIPAGDGPFPVIVMNHGYFNRVDYYSGDGTDRASEFLLKRGYITLSSDYRSWGASDIGPSLFYSGLTIDVVNLLNAIPSISKADASHIGMWGHSMGGGVTIKVLTLNTRVKAAVLYSTVSADQADVIDRWGMGCFGDIAAGEKLYGCNSSDIIPLDLPPGLIEAYKYASANDEYLRQISPFYHLDRVTAPIQIHYGAEDGKVLGGTPPEWSRKLYIGLHDLGKDVELFGYDNQIHSFKADEWFAFMERAAQFFDRHVKNIK
jgi:dipeptidyl aminopeptidase/acylaminoacyl peptidase